MLLSKLAFVKHVLYVMDGSSSTTRTTRRLRECYYEVEAAEWAQHLGVISTIVEYKEDYHVKC